MKNWFLNLEDKLINFLTAICWWLDLHFDVKSKKIADVSMICIYLVLSNLTRPETKTNLIFIIIDITICYILFLLNNFFLSRLYKDSLLSPNPNRHDKTKSMILILFLFNVAFYFTLSSLTIPASLFFWYYILCTEPMPPKEKVARKEKNEMRKMQPSGSS